MKKSKETNLLLKELNRDLILSIVVKIKFETRNFTDDLLYIKEVNQLIITSLAIALKKTILCEVLCLPLNKFTNNL